MLFKKLPESSGLRLRIPLPFVDRERTLPPIASKTFREQHPEFIEGEPGQPTVAFFTGCGINYLYPEIGEAMLKAGTTVEQLADQNLEALNRKPVDHIVTACASCNAGLGKIYAEMGEPFEQMAAKVEDIFVFLARHGLPEKLAALPKKEKRVRVTYHDPCHLRTRGITKEPRQILKALPQVDYIEMADAGTCCGLGGTYSVYHYETSQKIGAKKAQNINDSQAEMVATDCPGCIMQLQDSINHAGQKQQAVHILNLLVEALDELG